MATASWRTCRKLDEMRPPKFHPNWYIDRRVISFPTFCNMAAVRHLEFKFRYSGPPTKSTVRFDYSVKQQHLFLFLFLFFLVSIRSSPPEILRFYNFASLAGKCLTTPLLRVFWGCSDPLKLRVVIQTPKGTSLGDDASFKP